MYILGALLSNTALMELFTLDDVIDAVKATFAKGQESNIVALQAGYDTVLKAE
jgi:hypothetical protein